MAFRCFGRVLALAGDRHKVHLACFFFLLELIYGLLYGRRDLLKQNVIKIVPIANPTPKRVSPEAMTTATLPG